MRIIIFLLICMILMPGTGCRKEAEDVNVLSVKVDDSLWTAHSISSLFHKQEQVFQITAFFSETDNRNLSLYFHATTKGTYTFDQDYTKANARFSTYPEGMFASYTTLNPEGVIVVTKFDTVNGLISGTFSFVAYSDSVVKKIFSDGKFSNLRYMQI